MPGTESVVIEHVGVAVDTESRHCVTELYGLSKVGVAGGAECSACLYLSS